MYFFSKGQDSAYDLLANPDFILTYFMAYQAPFIVEKMAYAWLEHANSCKVNKMADNFQREIVWYKPFIKDKSYFLLVKK